MAGGPIGTTKSTEYGNLSLSLQSSYGVVQRAAKARSDDAMLERADETDCPRLFQHLAVSDRRSAQVAPILAHGALGSTMLVRLACTIIVPDASFVVLPVGGWIPSWILSRKISWSWWLRRWLHGWHLLYGGTTPSHN
jgi:hypothetical protein